ncbi:hypothetical protein SGLAD_v1c03350 [Spiroplasma gladiatoris]|uniref:Uncharacterized protein n=1 Tax=Spiroplasma gladiatoris TaxID=2143 RepID=A0A4P7AGK6_9MOLU|nr:hypothetical protein [Spiroplasma gladiatoris]QBQ07534.1 hypothetical protein SGLAD_v1c03350 [Spiroplasma gladiatoris]
MKLYEKESLFWFGLHKIAKDDPELKYHITTQKELINDLYPLAYFGVIQYTLYRGISISEVPLEETNEYVKYIIDNIDEIYKIKYRFVKEKPKKINFNDKEICSLCEEIIGRLFIPFMNEYAFKKVSNAINMNGAYIRESLLCYEYDINHKSDDGKVKTSVLYPFLFTLNLIKIFDKKGLYNRILKTYRKDELIRKYKAGRDWKQKEVEYLQESYELLNNDEEWSLFLSNFSSSKWDIFDMNERFKALFQLTKITTILMKDEITAVTMLSDGEEVFEMLKNYLPMYIDYDRYIDEEGKNISDLKEKDVLIFSPFTQRNVNLHLLFPYIESKNERHIECDFNKLRAIVFIFLKSYSKVRTLLLTHEYLPKIIDILIEGKKKIFCDILSIFEEVKDHKYKRLIDFENFTEDLFFLTEEQISNALNKECYSLKEFMQIPAFIKMGKIVTFNLALKNYTARTFDYNLFELLKYLLIVFGPHPLDHTIQTKENIENFYKKFENFVRLYEEAKNNSDILEITNELQTALELPLKLLNWKKD